MAWRRSRKPTTRAARPLAAEQARGLALGLAGLQPLPAVDPMAIGLVIEPGEHAYQVASAWVSYRDADRWTRPSQSRVVVTDRRLMVGMPLGPVTSLWWGSLVGFHPDLVHSSVVLDYGDGYPRSLSGPDVASVVVVGIAQLYGVFALAEHAALEPLRDRVG